MTPVFFSGVQPFSRPCTTSYGWNSFTYTAAKFWNASPVRLRARSCLNDHDFIRAIRQQELHVIC